MSDFEFIFIDESGEPGIKKDSSTYYAELAFQISSDAYQQLTSHLASWRYIRGVFTETKRLPRGPEMERFLKPIHEMQVSGSVKCSCVYLLKNDYTGPYLKPDSPKGQNAISFRNFVHRQLLEFHFSQYPATTANIELVFDRYEMTPTATANLESYLHDNYNLPPFKHITHANSLYCEALQIAGQLVNLVKIYIQGTLNTEKGETEELMSFISLKDITKIQKSNK